MMLHTWQYYRIMGIHSLFLHMLDRHHHLEEETRLRQCPALMELFILLRCSILPNFTSNNLSLNEWFNRLINTLVHPAVHPHRTSIHRPINCEGHKLLGIIFLPQQLCSHSKCRSNMYHHPINLARAMLNCVGKVPHQLLMAELLIFRKMYTARTLQFQFHQLTLL